jgi:hypothetical protein
MCDNGGSAETGARSLFDGWVLYVGMEGQLLSSFRLARLHPPWSLSQFAMVTNIVELIAGGQLNDETTQNHER